MTAAAAAGQCPWTRRDHFTVFFCAEHFFVLFSSSFTAACR